MGASRSILFNSAWSTLFIMAARGGRFLAVALCVRYLGAYEWGQIASTFVTLTFLYFLVDQGLNLVPSLHRVNDPAVDAEFLRRITAYRTVMAAIVIGTLFAWDAWVRPVERLVLLFSFVLLPRAWNLDWWFQRNGAYYLATGVSAAKVLFFLGGIVLLVRPGADPSAVIFSELAAEAAGILLSMLLLRRARKSAVRIPGGGTPNPPIGYLRLFRMGQPFLWIGVLHALHQSVDVLFLKYMSGYASVGEYDVGYKIGYFLFFVGATLVQIIRPRLTAMWESGGADRIGPLLVSASRLLSSLSAAFVAFSFYLAGPVLSLVFGQDTPLARLVFQWASVWVCTAFMTMLCADTLLSLGMRAAYLAGCVLCAGVNVAGNFFLISAYGPEGAIFATILAEAAFLAFAYFKLPGAIRATVSGPLLRQGTVCAVLTAAFLAALHAGLPHAAAICLSVACVLAHVYFLKPFERSNLAALRET